MSLWIFCAFHFVSFLLSLFGVWFLCTHEKKAKSVHQNVKQIHTILDKEWQISNLFTSTQQLNAFEKQFPRYVFAFERAERRQIQQRDNEKKNHLENVWCTQYCWCSRVFIVQNDLCDISPALCFLLILIVTRNKMLPSDWDQFVLIFCGLICVQCVRWS